MPLPDVAYRIDASDRIVDVSGAWISFAKANSGERVLPARILGTSMWSSIADATTREVYRIILGRVRGGVGAVRFQFRCDSPDVRRLLQMQVTVVGADGDVAFQTHLVQSQPRTEVGALHPESTRSDAVLTICGWCMRVSVNGKWMEIEEAIHALGLFERSLVPQLSHGMCPACLDTMMASLDDPELGASGQVTVGALP